MRRSPGARKAAAAPAWRSSPPSVAGRTRRRRTPRAIPVRRARVGKDHLTARHSTFSTRRTGRGQRGRRDRVDLTLSMGGSIAGTVVGKDGRTPVAWSRGRPRRAGINRMGFRFRARGGSGNFRFGAPERGPLPRFGALEGEVDPKEVVLAESQRLDGVLLETASGALLEGHRCRLPAERRGGIRIFASGRDYGTARPPTTRSLHAARRPSGSPARSASTAFPSSRSASKSGTCGGRGEVHRRDRVRRRFPTLGSRERGETGRFPDLRDGDAGPAGSAGGRASGQTTRAVSTLSKARGRELPVDVDGPCVSYRRLYGLRRDDARHRPARRPRHGVARKPGRATRSKARRSRWRAGARPRSRSNARLPTRAASTRSRTWTPGTISSPRGRSDTS